MYRSLLAAGCVSVVAAAFAVSPANGHSLTDKAPTSAFGQGLSGVVSAGAPGALVLAHGPAGQSVAASGVARLGGSRPIGARTPFRAGSVTKTFLAVTVLRLVAEGRLALDDSVEQHLPVLLPHGDEITVRQLLQHTSGLSDLGSGRTGEALLEQLLVDRRRVFGPRELVASVARRPLLFRPGRGWSYSNAGYVVLGMIVEQVAQERLADVLRERIIVPLRLRHTRLASGVAMPTGSAHGYLAPGNPLVPTPGGKPVDVTATDPSWTWAAGALVSTASDISRFYGALLAGRLLPAGLLKEMTTARPIANGAAYGLGLLRLRTPCGFAYGHDGEIFGYTTLALATGDARRSAVLVANVSTPGSGAVLGRLVGLASLALCGRTS